MLPVANFLQTWQNMTWIKLYHMSSSCLSQSDWFTSATEAVYDELMLLYDVIKYSFVLIVRRLLAEMTYCVFLCFKSALTLQTFHHEHNLSIFFSLLSSNTAASSSWPYRDDVSQTLNKLMCRELSKHYHKTLNLLRLPGMETEENTWKTLKGKMRCRCVNINKMRHDIKHVFWFVPETHLAQHFLCDKGNLWGTWRKIH